MTGGGLTDTSLIQKYKISDESYDKRKGTMREYIRNQRALNPNFQLTPTTSGETSEDLMVKYGQESVQHIELGDNE
jgi:tubulin-folding cofactor B